jgi:hypothetical protein
VLASLKQNICPPATPWSFVVDGHRVVWGSACEHLNADELLASTVFRPPETPPDVEAFLQEYLAEGPRLQGDIVRAATDRGITESRLFRTRKRICDCEKVGFGTGRWYWRLKEAPRSHAIAGLSAIPLTNAKNGDSESGNADASTTSPFFAGGAKNGERAKNGAETRQGRQPATEPESAGGNRVERIRESA